MRDKERIVEKNGKLYKLNLIIDRTATDIHHILGQKYKHIYNVNVEQNKIRIPRIDHVNYNNFVKGDQSPRGAMSKLYELCKQVLRPDIRDIFEELLYHTDDENFYIPEVIKGGKKKKADSTTMSILKHNENVNTD